MKNDCNGVQTLSRPLWLNLTGGKGRSWNVPEGAPAAPVGGSVKRAAPNQLLLRPLQSEARTHGHTEVRTTEEGSVVGAVGELTAHLSDQQELQSIDCGAKRVRKFLPGVSAWGGGGRQNTG